MTKERSSDPYRVAPDGCPEDPYVQLPPHPLAPPFEVGDYRVRIDYASAHSSRSGESRAFLVVRTTVLQTTNVNTLPGAHRSWAVRLIDQGAVQAADFLDCVLTDSEKLDIPEMFQSTSQGARFQEGTITLFDYGQLVSEAAPKAVGRELVATFTEGLRYVLVKWSRGLP